MRSVIALLALLGCGVPPDTDRREDDPELDVACRSDEDCVDCGFVAHARNGCDCNYCVEEVVSRSACAARARASQQCEAWYARECRMQPACISPRPPGYHPACEGGMCTLVCPTTLEPTAYVVTFARGSSELDETGRATLRELFRAGQARTDLRGLRIEGHAEPCGEEAASTDLSQARARTVARELEAMDVPRYMMEPQGVGGSRPRTEDPCSADERSSSRRVELSFRVCATDSSAERGAP